MHWWKIKMAFVGWRHWPTLNLFFIIYELVYNENKTKSMIISFNRRNCLDALVGSRCNEPLRQTTLLGTSVYRWAMIIQYTYNIHTLHKFTHFQKNKSADCLPLFEVSPSQIIKYFALVERFLVWRCWYLTVYKLV